MPEAEALLAQVARETGQTPEEIARRALLDVMEDYGDAKLADERNRTSDGVSLTLEEILAKYPDVVPTAKSAVRPRWPEGNYPATPGRFTASSLTNDVAKCRDELQLA